MSVSMNPMNVQRYNNPAAAAAPQKPATPAKTQQRSIKSPANPPQNTSPQKGVNFSGWKNIFGGGTKKGSEEAGKALDKATESYQKAVEDFGKFAKEAKEIAEKRFNDSKNATK